MITAHGTIPFPAAADARPVAELAHNLHRVAQGLRHEAATLRGIGDHSTAVWSGQASRAFRAHLGRRSGDIDDVAGVVESAVPALETFAAAIQANTSAYAAAVADERAARAGLPETALALVAAIGAEGEAVAAHHAAGALCGVRLQALRARLAIDEVFNDIAETLNGDHWFGNAINQWRDGQLLEGPVRGTPDAVPGVGPPAWLTTDTQSQNLFLQGHTDGDVQLDNAPGRYRGEAEGEAFWGSGWIRRGEFDVLDGTFQGEGSFRALDGLGAEGSAEWQATPRGLLGEAEGSAWAGERVQVDGSLSALDGTVEVEGSAQVFGGARVNAEGTVDIGYTHATVRGEAEAFAGAEARASVEADALHGLVATEAEASAQAGAGAAAEGSAHIGVDGVGASGRLEAWAGARVAAAAQVQAFDGHFEAGAEIGARAGVGGVAALKGEVGFERVEIDIQLGAALGLGGDVRVHGAFSPSGIANDVIAAGDSVGNRLGEVADEAGEALGNFVDQFRRD